MSTPAAVVSEMPTFVTPPPRPRPAIHPEVGLRVHRAHLQLVYDGSVQIKTLATLLGRDGKALPYGHHSYHRIAPADWWQGTPRHHLHAAVQAHHTYLAISKPAGLDDVPLHLHPEGHPYHPRTGERTAGHHHGFHAAHRWRMQDIALEWDYGGHLHVQITSVLQSPNGALHAEYADSHDHYASLEDWWEKPTRLLILDALQAQHAHWSLDPHPPEHVPMHVHPEAHPYAEHVMPQGPTGHPALPVLDHAWVIAHQVAHKEREYGITIHPATHPLHPDYQPKATPL